MNKVNIDSVVAEMRNRFPVKEGDGVRGISVSKVVARVVMNFSATPVEGISCIAAAVLSKWEAEGYPDNHEDLAEAQELRNRAIIEIGTSLGYTPQLDGCLSQSAPVQNARSPFDQLAEALASNMGAEVARALGQMAAHFNAELAALTTRLAQAEAGLHSAQQTIARDVISPEVLGTALGAIIRQHIGVSLKEHGINTSENRGAN
jgi:predicted transcriptional regulator